MSRIHDNLARARQNQCLFYDVSSDKGEQSGEEGQGAAAKRYSAGMKKRIAATRDSISFLLGNKISANTLLPKLATTDVDIGCFQELKHEEDKFKALKGKLKSGRYLHDDNDIRQQWRTEGTPSLKGPKGGGECWHDDLCASEC